MKYFSTNLDASACRSLIKSLKAHDYEYCIVSLKNKASIVLSNCEKLTAKLTGLSEFEDVGIQQREMSEIHESSQYKTTHGNHGLLIDILS